MSSETARYELPGDIPTPFSIESHSSLRPAPLNFSRPRPVRPKSYHESSYNLGSLYTVSSGSSRPSEDSAPPPVVRFNRPDSDRTYSEATGDEEDETEDEAAPPPIVRKRSSSLDTPRYNPPSRSGQNNTPWRFQRDPDQDSEMFISDSSSAITEMTETTDDSASLAESTAESTWTGHSSVSDFAFDGRLGWSPRNPSQAEQERQRWAGPLPRRPPVPNGLVSSTSNTSDGSGRTATTVLSRVLGRRPSGTRVATTRSQEEAAAAAAASTGHPITQQTTKHSQGSTESAESRSSANSAPAIPPRMPRIIKHTSMDQMSEHINMEEGDGMSDRGSVSSTEWKSSEFDTSSLTVEQIHKLKKKGINPALYAEMQAARKGPGKKKRLIGPLTGNTFLS